MSRRWRIRNYQRRIKYGIKNVYSNNDSIGRWPWVLKSEADHEIHRQKRERCLAVAGRCFTKSNYHFVLARHGEDVKENNRRSVLYSKWRNRWLELAGHFEE